MLGGTGFFGKSLVVGLFLCFVFEGLVVGDLVFEEVPDVLLYFEVRFQKTVTSSGRKMGLRSSGGIRLWEMSCVPFE